MIFLLSPISSKGQGLPGNDDSRGNRRKPSSDFFGDSNNRGSQGRPSSDFFGNSNFNQSFGDDNVNIKNILGIENPFINEKL